MAVNTVQKIGKPSAMALARQTAQMKAGSPIRAKDLAGVSAQAASRALARLAEEGALVKAAKGLYYAPKPTPLGPAAPSSMALFLAKLGASARPTGASAANVVGLSTQVPAKPEFAVYAAARPRGWEAARITLRKGGRPPELLVWDAALLEVMRDGGRYCELDPTTAMARLREAMSAEFKALERPSPRLRRFLDAAKGEPPRVRAILGAFMEWLGAPKKITEGWRVSINPLSTFEFGIFRDLPNAKDWQAN